MNRYRVPLDELEDLVAQMQRFGARIDDAVGEADSTVNRLHATWTGVAAGEHRAAHAQWRAATIQMHEALATLRLIGDTAHGNYTQAATTNTAMWNL